MEYEYNYELPATDVLWHGCDKLVKKLLEVFPKLKKPTIKIIPIPENPIIELIPIKQ